MNPLSVFAEYGAIGVVILLFAGQIVFLQKTLMGKLNEIEEICIKLIDRWNRSDEVRDRRHEDMMKEIDDLSDSVAYLKGRINGRAS
tara:strand:- start:3433 stop:3693 length:261 start_codon:yes stop_codon:yes gene_type:complete